MRGQGSESPRRDSLTEEQEREPELEKGMKKRGKETESSTDSSPSLVHKSILYPQGLCSDPN